MRSKGRHAGLMKLTALESLLNWPRPGLLFLDRQEHSVMDRHWTSCSGTSRNIRSNRQHVWVWCCSWHPAMLSSAVIKMTMLCRMASTSISSEMAEDPCTLKGWVQLVRFIVQVSDSDKEGPCLPPGHFLGILLLLPSLLLALAGLRLHFSSLLMSCSSVMRRLLWAKDQHEVSRYIIACLDRMSSH